MAVPEPPQVRSCPETGVRRACCRRPASRWDPAEEADRLCGPVDGPHGPGRALPPGEVDGRVLALVVLPVTGH